MLHKPSTCSVCGEHGTTGGRNNTRDIVGAVNKCVVRTRVVRPYEFINNNPNTNNNPTIEACVQMEQFLFI